MLVLCSVVKEKTFGPGGYKRFAAHLPCLLREQVVLRYFPLIDYDEAVVTTSKLSTHQSRKGAAAFESIVLSLNVNSCLLLTSSATAGSDAGPTLDPNTLHIQSRPAHLHATANIGVIDARLPFSPAFTP
jgi:hypothetical protein